MNKKDLLEISDNIYAENKSQIHIILGIIWKFPGCHEYAISDSTGMGVSDVRSVLHKMKSMNVLSSKRVKDSIKGFYVSQWRINYPGMMNSIVRQLQIKKEALLDSLRNEQENVFYSCSSGCSRVTELEAVEQDYTCTACEKLLRVSSNAQTIENLHKLILRTEQKIVSLRQMMAGEKK